jgi:hypothetical protein
MSYYITSHMIVLWVTTRELQEDRKHMGLMLAHPCAFRCEKGHNGVHTIL